MQTATLITVVREQNEETPSCCAIGQTSEEISAMKQAMEECGVEVKVIDLTDQEQVDLLLSDAQLTKQVEKLLNLYGALALPMIVLDGKIIAIGVIEPSEAVEALKEALLGR
jgi:glutaredoxin